MHTGHHYKLSEFLIWTRRDIYWCVLLATVPTLAYEIMGWKWLAIPWVPIALIGTAAAFLVGFKNTQTYNRLWEARQIYGGIVNTSRAWGVMVRDVIGNKDDSKTHQILFYRHFAWLTALRFQLREPRSWETIDKVYNVEYRRFFLIPERESKLDDELKKYLSSEEWHYVLGKKNRASHALSLQSKHIRELRDAGKISDLHHVELQNLITALYEHQGKAERIKNFPYPRHFATINLFFIRLFVILIPFGVLQEFQKLGDHFAWFTIPFSAVIGWVFLSLEKIGESTENPFEGNANDVPITALSKTIEIDMREMLDETDLPAPQETRNNILM